MPSIIDTGKRILGYAAAGTIGSLFISYGLREFLRATGGGYYCCNHATYQGLGVLLTFFGWAILLVAAINLYQDLSGQ